MLILHPTLGILTRSIAYDDYFWEHILSPSDREFLAKHDIHCGTITSRVAALSDSFLLSGSPT